MSEIKLGALYDPRLLPDYGGPLYNHMSAKLVQQNIVDLATGSFVAPWDEYNKLRTGTVVIMKVSFHTYTMSFNGNAKKASAPLLSCFHIDIVQVYHIYADHIKIVLPSDKIIDTRHARLLGEDLVDEDNGSDSEDEKLKCFDTIAVTPDPSSSASVRGSLRFGLLCCVLNLFFLGRCCDHCIGLETVPKLRKESEE